jgi:DNA-nicking Smr family endonuclease
MRKPTASSGAPSGNDATLWRAAMRNVAPLPGRTFPVAPPEPPARQPPSASAKPRPAPALPPLERRAGVDRASTQRLKRGLYAIEARLDLHGMTQADAHAELRDFVVISRAAGRRCVLVITGQGRDPDLGHVGGGILKNAVPRWLDEAGLRHHVLATAPARPPDGGGGALYLLLRKQRGEPAS